MSAPGDDDWAEARAAMVRQLVTHKIRDPRVMAAMARVRRHRYIPAAHRHADAYGDHPCPIGHDATISQPFIVAYMTEKLVITPGMRVLEIGTGSGYQAAILAELGAEVFTIERIAGLVEHARQTLADEGYDQVHVRAGDGQQGWPEAAPFDAVMVTCAPGEIPPALPAQLVEGGRMILPLDAGGYQRLVLLRKERDRVTSQEDIAVRFVPMIGGLAGSGVVD